MLNLSRKTWNALKVTGLAIACMAITGTFLTMATTLVHGQGLVIPNGSTVNINNSQLNIAGDIINGLGLDTCFEIVGIAKKDAQRGETADKIFKPGRANPVNFGREADLLLHVIDASNETYPEQIAQVNAVLKEIGADKVPQIEVFNKVDMLPDYEPRLDRGEDGEVRRAWCSAQTGAGLDLLQAALDQRFSADQLHEWIRVPAANGRLRAKLFDLGKVLKEQVDENGDLLVEVELARRDFENLQKTEGVQVSNEALVH